MTMQAIWNGAVLARSDDTVVVEGNHYFPLDSLERDHFSRSTHTSLCPWKGTASYYTLTVDGQTNPDAAWEYETPSALASELKERVAFWRGVEVVPADG